MILCFHCQVLFHCTVLFLYMVFCFIVQGLYRNVPTLTSFGVLLYLCNFTVSLLSVLLCCVLLSLRVVPSCFASSVCVWCFPASSCVAMLDAAAFFFDVFPLYSSVRVCCAASSIGALRCVGARQARHGIVSCLAFSFWALDGCSCRRGIPCKQFGRENIDIHVSFSVSECLWVWLSHSFV